MAGSERVSKGLDDHVENGVDLIATFVSSVGVAITVVVVSVLVRLTAFSLARLLLLLVLDLPAFLHTFLLLVSVSVAIATVFSGTGAAAAGRRFALGFSLAGSLSGGGVLHEQIEQLDQIRVGVLFGVVAATVFLAFIIDLLTLPEAGGLFLALAFLLAFCECLLAFGRATVLGRVARAFTFARTFSFSALLRCR